MKISFKETKNGEANEIFVDDTYIGTVEVDIWNGKWTMRPDFNYYSSKKLIKKMKFDSFYKAGKAMAKLYADTFVFFDEEYLIEKKKGSIVMFPSNFCFPHAVTPVSNGDRHAIITWIH